MEHYKEKLKIQNIALSIACIVLAIFAMLAIGSELGWISLIRPIAGDSHWQSTWYGYICGASIGVFAMMLFLVIRNRKALKDEAKLKKLYIQSNDERTAKIYTLARNTAMQILLYVGLVATVIAGYFSITVSITILVCLFVCSITCTLLAHYYSRIM